MINNKNSNIDVSKNRRIFFIALMFAGALFVILYLSLTGNTTQIFNDVVNEYTAMDGSNKSAERNLFYILSIAGIIIYSIFYLKITRISKEECIDEKSNNDGAIYVVLSLLIFTGVYYFVYSGTNWLLISGIILAFILFYQDKTIVVSGIAFMFTCAYAICAIYRLYVFVGGHKSLSMVTVSLFALIASILPLIRTKRQLETDYLQGIMSLQLIIPCNMLLFVSSRYKYGEDYIFIHIPNRVSCLIVTLIILFIINAIYTIIKKWRSAKNLGEIITCGTCIVIMAFNRFSGSGSILSTDLHHPFENIIGYSQIFELGQKAFTEYIPVSGMYSVIQGFFLSFFGKGKVSFYYLTQNLFYLAVIIIIVMLLKAHLKGEWLLFISLIFPVIDYNRIALIVPIMLILSLPRLIKNKNLWLKMWFLTSFINGLYYPVFGAAVCLGYLPLGIWQIFTYISSGNLKKDIKRVSFWVWWIICFLPVVAGLKLLLGTVKHMKAMGGQTVYADGITRFGQAIPNNFFSYFKLLSTRLILYYVFSFLIVICIVWISTALCLKLGNVKVEEHKVTMENPKAGFVALSFGIALVVSFSYTVIRMDISSIYARSAGVVYASFIMIILVVSNYMRNEKNRFVVFAFAIFIIAAVSAESFFSMESNSKLAAYYTVPNEYTYVVNDQVVRLGECFVQQSTYDDVENAYNYVSSLNKDSSYLGIVSTFGKYYLYNVKGDSVMEIGTIKGFNAAQETIDLLRKNDTIVGSNISSINNYYLYYWLVMSGEYIWQSDTRMFVPNSEIMTVEDIHLQNKYIELSSEGASLGRTAGSWGNSMDTLYDIFSDSNVEYSILENDNGISVNFDKIISGEEADFAYIEFQGVDDNYQYTLFNHSEDVVQNTAEYFYMKRLLKKDYNRDIKVVISWTDENGSEHSMNCRMEKGKLLIPLGGGRGWLLNNHSYINITVYSGETIISVPEVTEFEMLKLREAG